MGTRISCASLFLWEYSIYDIVDILLEAGIGSIEFWVETPHFWMNRNDETSQMMLEEAISIMPDGCTLHAPILDLNPASYNDYVYEATIKETLWSLELAQRIMARVVTIHPGKRTVKRTPTSEDWDKFLRYLKICKDKADSLNLNLSLENSMPYISSMCSSPDEMKEVLDKFPGLFFTLDIVHALNKSHENAMSFIKELNHRMINIHAGAPHDGKVHYPVHRMRNIDKVLEALQDCGYNGDLTIEIDDKAYSMPMSREDKIRELIEEREYLESRL
ncbi:sugar phosphate isomerase/epimerase [Candidatus Methanoperedens nitroreducens]|uniref:Sugar phosphate isomerase/epimerase n=1 Tax=Candidatus Methanoperedens nitratireducens TaxID=1392998 RepID=A0A062V4V8_9EURY|nr:sugar phosphate isomerase/epimerase [Candidatus Methanoperedens nitroreducens]KCZ72357.1 sugar phosphate isomerase/epimerase [Candidatus Methanoperedens nitroreducens]MDJ1423709.1 sugar phosphate isomerase/epimerase [Candidatus Methanoperedens sp.]